MEKLTKKQAAILQFLETEEKAGRPCPTQQELANRFGFASTFAAACHIKALIKKGALIAGDGKARSLRLASRLKAERVAVVEIPIFGSIPAGFGDERRQEADGCITVDITSVGFKPTRNTFALRVKGDSMIGKHICDGDVVILEHGPQPRNGEVVAALIDRKTTLKTFVQKNGRQFLKAENPDYPNLIPSEELVIQGVFKALIRKA